MLSTLPILALLPLGALAGTIHPRGAANLTPFLGLVHRDVSPDNTCGPENGGYTCPSELACCSQFGFCGATDSFCLTTENCQPDYSNTTEACYAPVPGETVSPDGTCGTTGDGTQGYVCPGNATVTSCCSVA
ncbi:carbohydrate-binding module family 18 protein [Dichotomopilus funicola]|uniref:Carbohydrate-binding module family 18 protein n=1 Tax=Dichotomopilus funicola TaxID=1934379 RepID=A0AAN6UZV7_9PEZI|nr:carbohydrate-binding module family 18 protein [Dichotomopilus funicola]